MSACFTLTGRSDTGRRGELKTKHGVIQTPFFMPVGTLGAMKGLSHEDLNDLGAQILLSNTYHLHLQPGEQIVAAAGGLHDFISWNKPMLTDSGGFQVFSFGKNGRTKLSDDGVQFQSHLNGDTLFIGPDESMAIQHALGADIIMVFDECPPSTAPRRDIQTAVDRTLRWAQRCKDQNEVWRQKTGSAPLLFGIVQGGLERDIREKCAEELIAIGFDGYALGGLAVGESEADMLSVVDTVCPILPPDAPRYLMGVGTTGQLKQCVARGIDMFDCVLPVRQARHGSIEMMSGDVIRIQNAQYKNDYQPLDADSPSSLGRAHSRAYVHHLIRAKERFGETIAAHQNLAVTLKTMQTLRSAIESELKN